MISFPASDWEFATPEESGFSSDGLNAAVAWQGDRLPNEPYRILVSRHGKIVGEWERGLDRDFQHQQASASKSTYGAVLAIAVREGKIGSIDDRVADYYPEMLDVPPGTGPKEGRHYYPANDGITFKHLIGNVSGYMKPGEAPGKVFNYQTFGMNILCHAIAVQYSLYRTSDPEQGGGIGKLTEWKIRDKIGGSWGWAWGNFDLPPEARLGIYGYNTNYTITAQDMARCGLLWMQYGNWNGEQVIPEEWLREATRTNSFILENEPEENWLYGLGFWVNDKGICWPNLPANSFAASGAGGQHIWVWPDKELIIVQSPGTYARMDRPGAAATVEKILEALT
ncbi:MAG: serine hydrolase [Chloroflexi bacterium]|nr:serine hydrolase [Chloroflexota bacterium]